MSKNSSSFLKQLEHAHEFFKKRIAGTEHYNKLVKIHDRVFSIVFLVIIIVIFSSFYFN